MIDPHGWNTWENYRAVHERRTDDDPFVLENHLEWTIVGDPRLPEAIILSGILVCRHEVQVRVRKRLETRRIRTGRLQVRGLRYAYNAYWAGRGNLLRYDNGHSDPSEFHRHRYDPAIGQELELRVIARAEMPTLAEFLSEVEAIVIGEPRE